MLGTNEGKINKGKTYLEYLDEAKRTGMLPKWRVEVARDAYYNRFYVKKNWRKIYNQILKYDKIFNNLENIK